MGKEYSNISRRDVLRAGLAGLPLVILGCTLPGNVKGQVTGGSTGVVSYENFRHNLDLISVHGDVYFKRAEEGAVFGFSLIPYSRLERTADEGNIIKGLISRPEIEVSSKQVYLARQMLVDGKAASIAILKRNAKMPDVTATEDPTIKIVAEPKMWIKTITLNGVEMYLPAYQQVEGRLNFLSIPREGSKIGISAKGKLSIINPGNIYEWVERSLLVDEMTKKNAKLSEEYNQRVRERNDAIGKEMAERKKELEEKSRKLAEKIKEEKGELGNTDKVQ